MECEHRGGVFPLPWAELITTTGLGAVISRATDSGNFPVLLGATIVMAALVVTVNRLLWRQLYTLASTKYKMET